MKALRMMDRVDDSFNSVAGSYGGAQPLLR